MILDLDKRKRYLLGCSFGPDSMSLFDMLIKQGYEFEVAHVNYKLRPEADKETLLLKKYCDEKVIACHILEVDAKKEKGNTEEICRKIRYQYFKSIFNGFDYLLIAHNEDDVIETYLMQKDRKNIVNYYGIKKNITLFGVPTLRPLLGYKKKELLEYCLDNNVPYAIDSSNLKDIYKRNRIRHNYVESLDDFEREVIFDLIKQENDRLEEIREKVRSRNLLSASSYFDLSDYEYVIAINEMIRRFEASLMISKKYALNIRKNLLDGIGNAVYKINLKFAIEKNYDKLRIINIDKDCSFNYVLEKPRLLDTDFFYLDFSIDGTHRGISKEDYPIVIRNAENNDVVKIKNYKKTIRRLFIDWKMPLYLRKRWPLIINNKMEVVYCPRYQKDLVIPKDCDFYVKFD